MTDKPANDDVMTDSADELDEPTDEEVGSSFGDYFGRDITPDNAMVVLAKEMRHIRHVLEDGLQTTYCEGQHVHGLADLLAALIGRLNGGCAGCGGPVEEDTGPMAAPAKKPGTSGSKLS
jgi:hypothetical protein